MWIYKAKVKTKNVKQVKLDNKFMVDDKTFRPNKMWHL